MSSVFRKSRLGTVKFNLFGALAFGALMLPAASRATDLREIGRADDLRMQLAASGKSLSTEDMAKQKGAGLSRPGFIDQRTDGLPRVLLWDELRILPLPKPAGNGVVTGNGIGR